MKTKAVRLYGADDLRFEEFELPPIKEDEILAKVVSDSLCMSSYKETIQGAAHKRVPQDVAENPIIIGHEFCGELLEVGAKWQHQYKAGEKFAIQPAINYDAPYNALGYSYPFCGGNATHVIIPAEAIEKGCVLKYDSDVFYYGSLAEPVSCLVGAFHAMYHTKPGVYVHDMGIRKGGNMAMLASVGPMGLGAIDIAIHCDRRPKLLVVTDIDEKRLKRAEGIYTKEEALKHGVELHYVNTSEPTTEELIVRLSGGAGYDDVFVFAPVTRVIEQAGRLLGRDGCLNFFAGPPKPDFMAGINFYDVHYSETHIMGTTGGSTNDMIESINLILEGRINPSAMITHIGGLNSVVDTTLNLSNIGGGKKLIYTDVNLELTAIDDFEEKGKDDPLFAELAKITKRHNGLWSAQAEKILLSNK